MMVIKNFAYYHHEMQKIETNISDPNTRLSQTFFSNLNFGKNVADTENSSIVDLFNMRL